MRGSFSGENGLEINRADRLAAIALGALAGLGNMVLDHGADRLDEITGRVHAVLLDESFQC